VLGLTKEAKKTSVDRYLAEVMGIGVELMDEYDRLLTLELTEEPDVYQNMLEELMTKCLGPDNKILPEYKEKFEAVARRFDEYEDNYVW
jgi:hypothetical protein